MSDLNSPAGSEHDEDVENVLAEYSKKKRHVLLCKVINSLPAVILKRGLKSVWGDL